MKKTVHLFVFSVFLSFNIHAQDAAAWKTYTTEAYELQYPSTWDFNNSSASIMDFLALSPLESKADKIRENINVVQENAQGLDLEAYFKSSKKMLSLTFPEMDILNVEDLDKNGIAIKWLTYTAKFGDDILYFKQAYTVYKNMAYVLTFTSEKRKYKKFKDIENTIFGSFKVLK